MDRAQVCQMAIDAVDGKRYLEVGVNAGQTFHKINVEQKVAVDPEFLFDFEKMASENKSSEYHQVTSDAYFSRRNITNFDVIYLDGLHTFEQTLRDLLNATLNIKETGIIIIDDILPNSYAASLKTMEEAFTVKHYTGDTDASWMGDVYRLVWFIDTFMQQFTYRCVSENHGQLVMWRQARNEAEITHRLMNDVVELSFGKMTIDSHVFKMERMDEIVKMIKARGA